MLLAELLKTLKEARHWSEAMLARRAGLPAGTLRKYLRGQRLPTLPAAAAVARALGVSLDVLADADDIKGCYQPQPDPPPRRRPKAGRIPGEDVPAGPSPRGRPGKAKPSVD